jgi:uncharacterized protein (DUF2236 family)
MLGWSRAILLQMAHPLIAAGVAQHSTFDGGPRQAALRLHGTTKAMLALTFGDEAVRDRTLARIRAIHQTVRGSLRGPAGRFAEGTPYSANDPELLLWVHGTLLESIVVLYGLVVGPLDTESRDRFCIESAPTLLALGGDPATAPRSWRALQQYMQGVHDSGVLHVTQEAREIARAVLWPRLWRLSLPGSSINRLFTIGLLPQTVRASYGLPWSRRRERQLRRAIRALRRVRRVTPAMIARWRER